mmetsp:Transcript_14700/g.39360  ORF Transcript_14700/g.39360 Transcript_14700/m.39360 type:complete len:431 (+) Transcript_14700:342-1634(+)
MHTSAAAIQVEAVKRKVAAEQKYDDALGCRLIFAGKVLQDSATVADSKISESGFIVVMPPKKAIAAKPKPSAAAASPSAAAAAPDVKPNPMPEPAPKPAPEPADDAPMGSPAVAAEPPSTPARSADPPVAPAAPRPAPLQASAADAPGTGMLMGPQFEQTVQSIMAMGFAESEVRRALRAAFNNPDRAVEYLCSGIPEQAEPTPPAPLSAAVAAEAAAQQERGDDAADDQGPGAQPSFNMFAPAGARPSAGGDALGGGRDGALHLDFLRSLPQFNRVRQIVQENPQMLQPLLQGLGHANPALLTVINANQEEFIRLLNEPLRAEEEAQIDEAPGDLVDPLGAADLGHEAAGGGGGSGANYSVVQVTEEEREQLSRLEALVGPMGLDRAAVIEAWLACDKNEEMAANYLLNNIEDFMSAANDEQDRPPGAE